MKTTEPPDDALTMQVEHGAATDLACDAGELLLALRSGSKRIGAGPQRRG